jgi:hypothetical protein
METQPPGEPISASAPPETARVGTSSYGAWTAHKAAHRQAKLDALHRRWNARREAVRPLRAQAAIEIALTQGALSIATQLYALAV